MKENENKVMESFYYYISENHINHVAEEFDRISADALEVALKLSKNIRGWFLTLTLYLSYKEVLCFYHIFKVS
ncbi:hypothetical protein [Acetoanaerobium sticklandii]|uniref:hypothetical protein n=1 Tax=Acetoanaerobium sticklandii TaxID=1511 RepID=UPI003A93196D